MYFYTDKDNNVKAVCASKQDIPELAEHFIDASVDLFYKVLDIQNDDISKLKHDDKGLVYKGKFYDRFTIEC